jgi:hypothetical protein
MSLNQYVVFLLFLVTSALWAQTPEKQLKGIITADSAAVGGIHVLNLMTEKATYSNDAGVFYIQASEDDLLVFTSTTLDYWRQSVSLKDYNSGTIAVKMTAKINKLDEVVVTAYPKINAKDLGIINYTPKQYTPAERRLKTATGLDMTASVGTMAGVSFGVDPIINWITGRTAMLKKELTVETKERLLSYLDTRLSDEFYENYLKIPKDKIESFKYYAVEDEQLKAIISQNNFIQTSFKLSDLAVNFNQLQSTDAP